MGEECVEGCGEWGGLNSIRVLGLWLVGLWITLGGWTRAFSQINLFSSFELPFLIFASISTHTSNLFFLFFFKLLYYFIAPRCYLLSVSVCLSFYYSFSFSFSCLFPCIGLL